MSPTPDQIEQALKAFWRGSFAELDRLVGEGTSSGPSICALLAAAVEAHQGKIALGGRCGLDDSPRGRCRDRAHEWGITQ